MTAARYWSSLGDGRVRCGLCSRGCVTKPGQYGACRVRLNEDGRLVLPFFGAMSSLAVDPIEKKPLYHFLPGSEVFSAGYLGCNLHCPFCQNAAISQSTDADVRSMSPEAFAEAAFRSGCPSAAHTYSEPLVHAEYVSEAMEAARERGLRNVLVTNGQASGEAAEDVLRHCDAANVDLKSFSPVFYREELGGSLEETLSFIRLAARMGVRLEITTLVIPGKNDGEAEMEAISGFVAGVSPDIPLHLSAYRPMYRYRIPPTRPGTLVALASVARRKLGHVYVGNVADERNDTACSGCGNPLVRRRGYAVDASGLAEGGRCARCGSPSGIFQA